MSFYQSYLDSLDDERSTELAKRLARYLGAVVDNGIKYAGHTITVQSDEHDEPSDSPEGFHVQINFPDGVVSRRFPTVHDIPHAANFLRKVVRDPTYRSKHCVRARGIN